MPTKSPPKIELGYWISSEEHTPNEAVHHAQRAEEEGFTFAMISDHFHPWIDRQGHSPFVWSVIGAIAHATQQLRLITAVTCPTMRTHPVIIAHAAATVATMMPGRFCLGVGTGENLNEHILGQRWPPSNIRREMLAEAVEVIRLLWEGGEQSHYGKYYTVENARLYTLPDEPPPIFVAASGKNSAQLAGHLGDGLIAVEPSAELVTSFRRAGGMNKPCYAKLSVCWAKTEAEARRIAHEIWPTSGLGGELFTELPLPAHFEQAAKRVSEEDVVKDLAYGPDPKRYLDGIAKFAEAGFTHLALHQIGPDQEGFFRFWEREIRPHFSEEWMLEKAF